MRGKFEASIFQRIFLEYAGSREEYEKNILELFKKNIVKRLSVLCSSASSKGAKLCAEDAIEDAIEPHSNGAQR